MQGTDQWSIKTMYFQEIAKLSRSESHPPQVKRGQGAYNTGSVPVEGIRSARMRTPKNLDL